MRLVFAGTPEVAVPSLDALLASEHEVVAVVTRPDAAAGRGRRLVASPVARRAAEAGIEVLKPARADDPAFLDRLRELAPDCCPVVAYGALLRQEALDIPRYGWVNLHFSLLPAWRGAAPVQHAILHGDDITGATTFQIERELDAGPVYGTVTEPIGPRDTSGDLLERLAKSGAELLVRTIDGIAKNELVPRPQGSEGVSYAPKLTPDDARVDFTAPALRVDRLIRACTPRPGRVDPLPRYPDQTRPRRTPSRRCTPAPRPARRHQPGRAGRHRHPPGAARRSPAARQESHARRRLGPRCPDRRRGTPRRRLRMPRQTDTLVGEGRTARHSVTTIRDEAAQP